MLETTRGMNTELYQALRYLTAKTGFGKRRRDTFPLLYNQPGKVSSSSIVR